MKNSFVPGVSEIINALGQSNKDQILDTGYFQHHLKGGVLV